MIHLDYLIPAILTLVLTLGLTWIFFPAWSAAVADNLSWEESNVGESDGTSDSSPILLSLVIPAYNEEDRIAVMLEAAYRFLDSPDGGALKKSLQACASQAGYPLAEGIEWIVVNDGSKDNTAGVVASTVKGFNSNHCWRLVSLNANSGKGAAVKTGMLLSKGQFCLMVDADGATDFGPGLTNLVQKMRAVMEASETAKDMVVAFGSRAHLQEESSTQRTLTRTVLMHAFHFFVSLLVSSRIHDTQCGFKLFTQAAARIAFKTLHLHRWAFDTEIVLLSEQQDIQIIEVPIPWHEVDGSKLGTSKFALAAVSITMLRDMICVRLCYLLGVWKVTR